MACIANLFRSEESVLRGAYAGKTVVVTGAGRGIGREVSVLLAKSGAARLILCSRTEGPLRETAALCNGAAAGRRDLAVTADVVDVTNERAVHAWASEFVARNPADTRVHYVISNAGAGGGDGMLNTDKILYNEVLATNFNSVLYTIRAWLPLVTLVPPDEQCGLINVSSTAGLYAVPLFPDANVSQAYCVAKQAVRGLTENLIVEFSVKNKRNISVTGVYPGHVGTHIVEGLRMDDAERAQRAKGAQLPPAAVRAMQWLGWSAISEGSTVGELEAMGARFFREYAPVTAGECARQLLLGGARGSQRVVVGFDAQFADFVTRLAPTFAYTPFFWRTFSALVAVRPLYITFVYRNRVVFYTFAALYAAATAFVMKRATPSLYGKCAALVYSFVESALRLLR